jgi:CRP/FNR family transcriptional regulator, anaerobic regulatory protein
MLDGLLHHIRKFIELTPDEEEKLRSHFRVKEIARKDHLLKEGQVCTASYFILKGCFRIYSMTEQGNEQIIQFGIDNWWMSDYMSLNTGAPSPFYIQAVEPSLVAVLDKRAQEELLKEVPALERYFRIVFQRAYAASVMRVYYIFIQSAEERYHHFERQFPDFVQRVPQYMLASFLGFTPEFLSKIRAKLAKK